MTSRKLDFDNDRGDRLAGILDCLRTTRSIRRCVVDHYQYLRQEQQISGSTFALGGRVAAITGGNRGIGRSIAPGMARAGAAVAVLSRNDEKNGEVLEELKAIGVPAMALLYEREQRGRLRGALFVCSNMRHHREADAREDHEHGEQSPSRMDKPQACH